MIRFLFTDGRKDELVMCAIRFPIVRIAAYLLLFVRLLWDGDARRVLLLFRALCLIVKTTVCHSVNNHIYNSYTLYFGSFFGLGGESMQQQQQQQQRPDAVCRCRLSLPLSLSGFGAPTKCCDR
jgi:hypothetical protein